MTSPNLKSRSEALAAGVAHYFTGLPCKRGHLGLRYVRTSNCVDCNKRPEHVQEQKIRVARSVDKKPAHYAQRSKKWWSENRVKARDYAKGYRSKNPDKVAAGSKAWDAANRDRRVAYALKQTLKRKSRLPSDFDEFDAFVALEAKRACDRRFAMTGYKWELDHMVPLNKGGMHKYDNMQVIPRKLNRIKSDRLIYTRPFEWVVDLQLASEGVQP